MEYQKIANLLDSALNQPYKFRTRNWIEIIDEIIGLKHIMMVILNLKLQC